eukprot:204260-Pelagomonas_calceolata.AAC.5
MLQSGLRNMHTDPEVGVKIKKASRLFLTRKGSIEGPGCPLGQVSWGAWSKGEGICYAGFDRDVESYVAWGGHAPYLADAVSQRVTTCS